jgi:RHS repeat-associated protein
MPAHDNPSARHDRLLPAACSGRRRSYAYSSGAREAGVGGDRAQRRANGQNRRVLTCNRARHQHEWRQAGTDSETGDVTTYYYDGLGNLLSVDLPDGRLIEYVIDGQNRRIGKKIDGVLTKAWLYKDQLKPIAELDGAGNLVGRFVYGSKTNTPDVVMKYNGGVVTTYRVISDHLGSPIMAVNVNNSADVPFKAEYSAFGERNLTSGALSADWMPFGFAGGIYDADTGLTRFGARDYDAVIGRWTAKDPMRFVASKNLYEYVWNDPTNLVDLTGLAPSNGAGGAGGGSSTGCAGSEGSSGSGDSLPEPPASSYQPTPKDWCGSSWNGPLIPEGFDGVNYATACKTHDQCYSTCGANKKGCDLNLSYDMAIDCAKQGGGIGCDTAAGVYYTAVALGGKDAWDKAQSSAGCTQ